MTQPSSQHLYVMQNEFGCIKIGRSVDPWQRLLNLRQTEHCIVELIAAFEGGGEDEEAIHFELDAFRLEGEWFDGGKEARAAIQQIFEPVLLDWKYAHDAAGAALWLDHLRAVRGANYVRQMLTRQIGILRAATEASGFHDEAIFRCNHLVNSGERVWILCDDQDGQAVNTWHNPETGEREVIPAYTATIEDALRAWPSELRPQNWSGSPIECCIAALTAMRSRLPKVPRPSTPRSNSKSERTFR